MTMMAESSMTWDEVRARAAERDEARRIRRTRTDLLQLPSCDVCQGATSGTTDPEVVCICTVRVARLNARLARIVQARDPDRATAGQQIAP